MLVSVSAKRPESNTTENNVERPVKRAKLSVYPSDEDKILTRTGDFDGDTGEREYTAEDAGPSDLYLDTVGPTSVSLLE